MQEYRGDFEVHLTVVTPSRHDLERFRQWCHDRGFKCVWIVLARGDNVEQPMATWQHRNSNLTDVLAEARQRTTDLQDAAFAVIRVKIEVAPHNADVPQLDADAANHSPDNYFEHHVKLRRDSSAPRELLVQACERSGAHLSRNAFRQTEAGIEERFVTLRSYKVGWTTSRQRLDRLLADLRELSEQIIECESEYCVYDSNLALDAGWLTASK